MEKIDIQTTEPNHPLPPHSLVIHPQSSYECGCCPQVSTGRPGTKDDRIMNWCKIFRVDLHETDSRLLRCQECCVAYECAVLTELYTQKQETGNDD